MATIYSTQFAAGMQSSGTNADVYTVPSGKVAVVRSISLTGDATSPNYAVVQIAGVAVIYGVANVPNHQSANLDCRQVLNAGQEINVNAIAGGWQYLISGYLLST